MMKPPFLAAAAQKMQRTASPFRISLVPRLIPCSKKGKDKQSLIAYGLGYCSSFACRALLEENGVNGYQTANL
jgi:hypothetical protein